MTLRRLLRWLSAVAESLFPWLNMTEMASDGECVVVKLLQQVSPLLPSK